MPKAGSSIRVRSSGRYEARYRGTDGKVRGKAFATEKEAKAFLIDVRKQVQDRTWSDPDLGRQTFTAVAAQWLAHERSKGSASEHHRPLRREPPRLRRACVRQPAGRHHHQQRPRDVGAPPSVPRLKFIPGGCAA